LFLLLTPPPPTSPLFPYTTLFRSLRVLRYVGLQRKDLSFTHAVFINAMPRDHQALEARVNRTVELGESRLARKNLQLIRDDANKAISRVVEEIPKRAYVLVFADMEAPKQWPWD